MSQIATCLQMLPADSPALVYWPTLSTEEQAFVAAYVENSYSIAEASEELCLTKGALQRMLMKPSVKKAILEVQEAMGEIDFLNEKWVKAQLLRIFPMVMGEEDVPMIAPTGEQISGRKFVPEAALKILEYVTPKKAPTVQIDIHNTIDLRSAIAEGQARRNARIQLTIDEEGEEC